MGGVLVLVQYGPLWAQCFILVTPLWAQNRSAYVLSRRSLCRQNSHPDRNRAPTGIGALPSVQSLVANLSDAVLLERRKPRGVDRGFPRIGLGSAISAGLSAESRLGQRQSLGCEICHRWSADTAGCTPPRCSKRRKPRGRCHRGFPRIEVWVDPKRSLSARENYETSASQ
jgi:hypothetical protein